MSLCESKIHTTLLKAFDISGIANKDAIEEAVLAEILKQVAADRGDDKKCDGDCPNDKLDKCMLTISVLFYREKIADNLQIDAYRDDDGHVSYRAKLSKGDAAKIKVGSSCDCVRRHRQVKWL
jgi:hypothetical protein